LKVTGGENSVTAEATAGTPICLPHKVPQPISLFLDQWTQPAFESTVPRGAPLQIREYRSEGEAFCERFPSS